MTAAVSFDQLLLMRLYAGSVCNVRTGCWEWAGGSAGTQGYGAITWGRRTAWRVHRLGYQLLVGPIPAGAWILHRCDNKPCWRPDHLYAGDHLQNMADQRGARWKGNGRNTWTHCLNGHPFDASNTHIDKRGYRHCRTCRREALNRYSRKRRAAA